MHFASLVLGVLAPSTVMADWLETTWECDADFFVMCGASSRPYSHFHTDFGSYYYGRFSYGGCHSTGVPGMTEFCIDWDRGRAHFKFGHQNSKRCLVKNRAGTRFTDDSCDAIECWRDVWNEVPCTW
ncbi:hypothetical protein N658DRAFT_504132 [Parathielavia hyrcaniae]|uniref:Secreted protein n=1 Tax=Parathielavia hyrcaniae TaxID=113614 RepID=A0AAN6Q6J6_9PEZI|nr:hypothetical protein N658DRAFT_504132 [Parathielavia hyrcaniae]